MTENENTEGNGGKEVFTRMVKAGFRTYFVNVKESKKGEKYMVITESKRVDNDKFERFRVMVFQNKLGEFMDAMQDAYQVAA